MSQNCTVSLGLLALAGREVEVERGVGIGALRPAFEQERRLVRADEHVIDVLEALQQELGAGPVADAEALREQSSIWLAMSSY